MTRNERRKKKRKKRRKETHYNILKDYRRKGTLQSGSKSGLQALLRRLQLQSTQQASASHTHYAGRTRGLHRASASLVQRGEGWDGGGEGMEGWGGDTEGVTRKLERGVSGWGRWVVETRAAC